MGIKPTCDYCNKEINEFGAILFSPPKHLIEWIKPTLMSLEPRVDLDEWMKLLPSGDFVKKFHVCVECHEKIKPRE